MIDIAKAHWMQTVAGQNIAIDIVFEMKSVPTNIFLLCNSYALGFQKDFVVLYVLLQDIQNSVSSQRLSHTPCLSPFLLKVDLHQLIRLLSLKPHSKCLYLFPPLDNSYTHTEDSNPYMLLTTAFKPIETTIIRSLWESKRALHYKLVEGVVFLGSDSGGVIFQFLV